VDGQKMDYTFVAGQ